MSGYEVCRDCEHYSVEDTVLCRDCAENGFIDLMRSSFARRMECLTGEYYYRDLEDINKFTLEIFECWFNKDPKKAGELIFKMFDASLYSYQEDGEV